VAIEYEKRTLGTDHAREQATDLAERVKAARARLHQNKALKRTPSAVHVLLPHYSYSFSNTTIRTQ